MCIRDRDTDIIELVPVFGKANIDNTVVVYFITRIIGVELGIIYN